MMAASKPTSWLSEPSHLVSHLARLGDLNRRSGLFPSRRRTLAPAVCLPCSHFPVFGACDGVVRLDDRHNHYSALPPRVIHAALPQSFSESSSYSRICLAFRL